MDNQLRERWFEMPIEKQFGNIGSEVNRAIRWNNKGDKKRAMEFCDKAVEFLLLSAEDPKNIYRVKELTAAINELKDHFSDNLYNESDDTILRYYDSFLGRIQ